MSGYLAFSSAQCPKCEETMLQRLVLQGGGDDDPYWKLVGAPFCDECDGNPEGDWEVSVITWKLLPLAERKMIVTLIRESLEDGSPSLYDGLEKALEKAIDNFGNQMKAAITRRCRDLIHNPSILENK